MKFANYPFDKQRCKVNFESNSLTTKNMLLSWSKTNNISLESSFRTPGFQLSKYVLETSNITYNNDEFSRVSITLYLKRESIYYLIDMYFPSILIVIISWSTFWLEISSPPARVSLGVTTMLTLVTTSKHVRAQLPKVTIFNAFDIWAQVCICKSKIKLILLSLEIFYLKLINLCPHSFCIRFVDRICSC